MINFKKYRITAWMTCFCFYCFPSFGADDITTSEDVRQQQRLEELQKGLQFQNSELAPQTEEKVINRENIVEVERPCFKISQLKFIINDPLKDGNYSIFNGLIYDLNRPNFIVNKCVGTKSLQNIIKYSQNELIKKGLITTQIMVDPQDLTSGQLVLHIDVGRIHQIISKDQSISQIELFNALALKKNEILNLKKIDQSLENLKRGSNREVAIKIEPALSIDGVERLGFSNLIITTTPYKKIGFNLGIDNSGSKNTGEYIGSLGIALNNPLHLNDSLNINLSHSLDDWSKDFNQSFYISYSIPFQNYDFSASYNKYKYEQFIAGFNNPILYSGKTQQTNLMLSRLISRGTHYKTSIYAKGYHKVNQNFIENIEVGVQRRETAGWNAGIQHRQYLGNALLELNVDYRRGTGAINAQAAPEEKIVDINGDPLPVEGYARAPLWSADIRYVQPFTIFNKPVQYRLNWRGQFAPKILVPQDRFYIGGRYSVRGFNGDIMLSGDNGHYLQQEFNWNSPIQNTQFYTGIDQGWVSGRNSYPKQRHLIGGVFGARSYFKGMYLDAFAGHSIQAPKSIKKEWVTGFGLSFSY